MAIRNGGSEFRTEDVAIGSGDPQFTLFGEQDLGLDCGTLWVGFSGGPASPQYLRTVNGVQMSLTHGYCIGPKSRLVWISMQAVSAGAYSVDTDIYVNGSLAVTLPGLPGAVTAYALDVAVPEGGIVSVRLSNYVGAAFTDPVGVIGFKPEA